MHALFTNIIFTQYTYNAFVDHMCIGVVEHVLMIQMVPNVFLVQVLPYSTKDFGGRKLWLIWNCKKIVGENFGS